MIKGLKKNAHSQQVSMSRISLTGEACRENLRNKDRWLLRMTTLGKCWCGISLISAASFLNAFSDAKRLAKRFQKECLTRN